MKKFISFFCALLVAGSVPAQGVYNMAKQQAKNAVASENKNQQAIASSGQPAPPPAPPNNSNPNSNPQADSALQATFRNIANLRADFENFAAGQTNRQPMINDLTEAAQGTKPSPASVSTLADHLASVAGNKQLQAQYQKLSQNVHAIFNSSHLSTAQQQMVCDGVQKILIESGASSDDVTNVISDLKTIAAETK